MGLLVAVEEQTVQKILMVPDNLLSEGSRASLLKRRSVELRTSSGAHGALREAEQEGADLVMFSAQLADMPAEDFCHRIRSLPACEQTKLLMITEKLGSAEDLFGLPIDGHLVKPVEVAQLMRTVAGLLNVRLREAERVPVDLVARLDVLAKDESGDQTAMVNILNLSENGMRLEAPVVLEEGCLGRIQFYLPGSKERLALYCSVRMLADEVLLHYGVELVGISKAERALLREYVHGIQALSGAAVEAAPEGGE